jgi:hypothetical protein
VLCLTAQRRASRKGLKTSLHVCKLSQGQYQVRKSLRLRLLLRVEAFPCDGTPASLQLSFAQRGFTGGEAHLAFDFPSEETRSQLLDTIRQLCSDHEGKVPPIQGVEASDLVSLSRPTGLTKGGKSCDTEATASDEDAVGRDGSGGAVPIDIGGAEWTAEEDAEVSELLDAAAAGGATNVEEVSARLADELAALEDANVHDLLEAAPRADALAGGLAACLDLLDDVDMTLGLLDAKLRHMREDISAIEGRNNELEARAEGGRRLVAALEGLTLAATVKDAATERLLAKGVIDSSK